MFSRSSVKETVSVKKNELNASRSNWTYSRSSYSWGWVVHLELSVKLQQGDEAWGRSLGDDIGGWGGSHMAADKERGQSWQGRGNGDGRREGRGNHTGRTTCSPSARAESSSDLCVYVSVCAIDWQRCWLNPTWRPVSWQHWCHKSGQGLECMSDWEPKRETEEKSMCISVCAVCIICVCVCGPAWVSASQPGSSVCLRSLSTSWVSQVLRCPLTPPGPPITAALQARSVNCHLLPDQY